MRRWFQVAAVLGTAALVICSGNSLARGQETPPAADANRAPGRAANPDSPRANLADEQPDGAEAQPPRREGTRANEQGSDAWLGVYLAPARQGAAGARIQQVFPAGPAARAGLWAGDVIVAADGRPIRSSDDLLAFVDAKQPRDEAKFTIQREGRQVEIAARLANREDFVVSPAGDERYGGGQYERRQYASTDDNLDFSSIPEYAMQLEQHRRQAEQIQRLETLICELRDDVQELRNALLRDAGGPGEARDAARPEGQRSATPPQSPRPSGQPGNSPGAP